MGSVNRVILVGNLGKDAELKFTPGGAAVSAFSLATTETWTKDGQKKEQTEWHKIVLWGKSAEAISQYLVKGKQIYVEGKIQTRKYDKDGRAHYVTEIKADHVVLLGGGPKREVEEPARQVATENGDDW